MNKNVLLINDLAGYGKVALSVMIPVLSHMGVQVHNLPTALVSNTLDYGKFDILDTTSYMKNTLKVWHDLDFNFDAIATGFIVNDEQSKFIRSYCKEQSKKGVLIVCDPIMGDEGSLYPGMSNETIDNMRHLISCADYVVPNFTEASLLTNQPYSLDPKDDEIKHMIDLLRKNGSKSVVITSVQQKNGHSVWGYDHKKEEYFSIPFDMIPVRLPGTGDIFSSVLLGELMKGKNLKESTQQAMDVVRSMILINQDNSDLFKGIAIETSLKEIK